MAALCRPACAEVVALLFEEKADGAVPSFLRETKIGPTITLTPPADEEACGSEVDGEPLENDTFFAFSFVCLTLGMGEGERETSLWRQGVVWLCEGLLYEDGIMVMSIKTGSYYPLGSHEAG